MNENLNQALTKLIEASLAAMDSAATFLQAEIPEVIHQLLLWHLTYHLIMFVTGLAIIASLIYVWVKYSGRGRVLGEGGQLPRLQIQLHSDPRRARRYWCPHDWLSLYNLSYQWG